MEKTKSTPPDNW